MPTDPEEGPSHTTQVGSFEIDPYPVTNQQFSRFAADTGYPTVAERPPDPAPFPGLLHEALAPAGGTKSSIADRMDHPAVHIAFEDAQAYAD